MTSRGNSRCGIRRLVGFLLLVLLFMFMQSVRFHYKLDNSTLSMELSFQEPEVFGTDNDNHHLYRRKDQQSGSYFSKHGKKRQNSISFASLRHDTERQGRPLHEMSKRIGQIMMSKASPGYVRTGNVGKMGSPYKSRPKYLEDLTYHERFLNFNSSTLPIVAHLKAKYPNMLFNVIPTDRWARLENTTCISSNLTFEESDFRAPYALILGAQKAGSSALANYLYAHSQIVPARKELHFLSERMDFYNNNFEGIDQARARKHYERQISSAMSHRSGIQYLSQHLDNYVIDATPSYLVKSDRVPHRTLCLCPWARLIVLLREPISRLYSQYNMEMVHTHGQHGSQNIHHLEQKLMRLGSLDEYVRRDYETLLKLGVLLPEYATDNEREQHYGSAKERESWKVYTKLGTGMPIGRGLYSIQLRQWMEAYKATGSAMQMLVINSDDMKTKAEETYRKVLDFLTLPHEFPRNFEEHHKHQYNLIEPMSIATRTLLERIYEPYNRQLVELLGPHWDGIWRY